MDPVRKFTDMFKTIKILDIITTPFSRGISFLIF